MAVRLSLFALSLQLLVGCSIAPLIDPEEMPRTFEWVPTHEVTVQTSRGSDSPVFLSCYNTKGDKGAHSYLTNSSDRMKRLEIASKSFPYALMASNSYHSEAHFLMPEWTPVKHFRGISSGFQADLYINERQKKAALIFRGTDNSRDSAGANYSFWFGGLGGRAPKQYQLADNLFRSLRGSADLKGYRFILTGHSLGGALAAYSGWSYPDVEMYLFDPSPRTWRNGEPATKDLYVIRESGEILTYLFFWKQIPVAEDKVAHFDTISGGPIREHKMYYLARSLLLISATEGEDANARKTMDLNLQCNRHPASERAQ